MIPAKEKANFSTGSAAHDPATSFGIRATTACLRHTRPSNFTCCGEVPLSGGRKPMSAMQRWGDAGRTPRVLAETRPDGATCIAALQYPMSEALNGVEYDPNPRRYNKSVAVYENTRASGGGSAQAVPRLDFGSLNTAWTSISGMQVCQRRLSCSRSRCRAACSIQSTLSRNRFRFPERRVPTLGRSGAWLSSSHVL